MKRKRRVRKPRATGFVRGPICCLGWEHIGPWEGAPFVILRERSAPYGYFTARDCRKLAAWLTRAADYIESKERKR